MSSKPIHIDGFNDGDYIVYQDNNGEYVMYHMSDGKLWRTSSYDLGEMKRSDSRQVEGIYQSDGIGKVILSGHEAISYNDNLGTLKHLAIPDEDTSDVGALDIPSPPGFEDDIKPEDLPEEPPAEAPVELDEEPTGEPEAAEEVLPPQPPAV